MNPAQLRSELTYKAVRSGGPGGQHANKVSTKVILTFNVFASKALEEGEKIQIRKRLKNAINKEGLLHLSTESYRSQHRNKQLVTLRFMQLVKKALEPIKKRRPTKRTQASIEARLRSKRKNAEKKNSRKRPNTD